MLIKFAQWAPDVAELNNPFTGDVNNVLCASASYIPFPLPAAYTDSLASRPLGQMAVNVGGTIYIFAGTADKLYRLDNTTLAWTDVSQALVTYSASATTPWSFAQFGNYIIAVNANDDPQVFELGVSTEFATLAGSPPRASLVRVWGDFVVLLRLTSNPNRIHWSGLNDIEQWTPGTNNSDFQDFPDGGAVQGSSSATNPIIFQESAIRRATFVPGSALIFTFQKIHDKRGAKAIRSIATRGSYIFYADEGGFYQISADGAINPIGYEKVDRTIFGTVSSTNLEEMQGAVDPFHPRVYWAYTTGSGSDFSTLLIYDWNLQRWSKATVTTRAIFPAATTGTTLEGLDSIAALDALPYSLDSRVWQGGAPVLACFDTSNRLAFFSGANAEATLTTQEMGDTSGKLSTITEVFPVVEWDAQSTVFAQLGTRYRRNDQMTWTEERQPSFNTGVVRKRSRGRFHRVRLRIPEGVQWSDAQGMDVKQTASGLR